MSKDLFYTLRSQEIAELVESAENGEITALNAYANLKRLNELTTQAVKQILPIALSEATAYGEKSFEAEGFNFEYRNGSKRYSFKNIEIWKNKQKELKAIEKNAKNAYELGINKMLVADDNGEVVELPELTYTSDTLILKK